MVSSSTPSSALQQMADQAAVAAGEVLVAGPDLAVEVVEVGPAPERGRRRAPAATPCTSAYAASPRARRASSATGSVHGTNSGSCISSPRSSAILAMAARMWVFMAEPFGQPICVPKNSRNSSISSVVTSPLFSAA